MFELVAGSSFRLDHRDEILGIGRDVVQHSCHTHLHSKICSVVVFRRVSMFGVRDDRTNFLIEKSGDRNSNYKKVQQEWNNGKHAKFATAVREIVVDALQKWGRNTWSRKSMLQYVDTCMAKKPVKYVDDVEN